MFNYKCFEIDLFYQMVVITIGLFLFMIIFMIYEYLKMKEIKRQIADIDVLDYRKMVFQVTEIFKNIK